MTQGVNSTPASVRPDVSMSDSDSDMEEPNLFWVSWFCECRGNEYFCEVDNQYLMDRFNFTGLGSEVPLAQEAYNLITDEAHKPSANDRSSLGRSRNKDSPTTSRRESMQRSAAVHVDQQQRSFRSTTRNQTYYMEDDSQDSQEEEDEGPSPQVAAAARLLYGLIHARYILTPYGMSKMKRKYLAGEFGQCPRILCKGQLLLPVGLSDVPRTAPVKLFCCSCRDVYNPKSSVHAAIDGAYFGTTFPHFFFQYYPALMNICAPRGAEANVTTTTTSATMSRSISSELVSNGADTMDSRSSAAFPVKEVYVPRIFGFRIASQQRCAQFEQSLNTF